MPFERRNPGIGIDLLLLREGPEVRMVNARDTGRTAFPRHYEPPPESSREERKLTLFTYEVLGADGRTVTYRTTMSDPMGIYVESIVVDEKGGTQELRTFASPDDMPVYFHLLIPNLDAYFLRIESEHWRQRYGRDSQVQLDDKKFDLRETFQQFNFL